MSVRLRTEVAQLSIVAGTRQEKANNIGLVERSAIVPVGAGKGNLYLLVEVTGDPIGKQAVHKELIDILSNEYLRVPGGITNGLRQAIRAANRLLYRNNLHSFPEDRRIGEASCAVLRGNDLYMGLAGDALVFVFQGESVRLFPPPPSRHLTTLVEEEGPMLSPLGVEEHLQEVGLFHCHFGADDVILLASSALPRLASQQELMEAAQEGLAEITRTLVSLASASDVSTLLIRTEAEEREEVVRSELLASKGRAIASGVKRVPVGQMATGVKKIPGRRIASGLGRTIAAAGAFILALFGGLARGVRGFFSRLASSGIFESLGRGVRTAFVNLLRGSSTMAKRMLPEPEAVPQPMEVAQARRARVVSGRRTSRLLPLIGVLSIICAVALVAAGLVLYNRARVAQFAQLLEDAQVEMDLALGSSAPAAIREHLVKAEESVERALQIRSTDPEAMALQDEVILALDDVNQVVRLEFAAHVPFTGPENQPRRALLHNRDVYVLDRGTQQLYGYFIDEQSDFQEPAGGAVLLGQEAIPGAAAIQELDDVIWMEAGNGRVASNLLVLVDRRSLLQFDGLRGFTPVSVAESQLWSEPRLIGGYFGFLYILDAAADRILKYTPTEDTYDSPPTDYFLPETSVELGNAVDMAIDGYIYVLLADGKILRFAGGQQEPFSVSGLEDHGLQNPTAIFTSPEVEYVYVADAGNERVVQLDKEGAFVRQFRPARESVEAVQNLQDVFVNEAGGELLVLSSEGLFLALIPEPPQVEK